MTLLFLLAALSGLETEYTQGNYENVVVRAEAYLADSAQSYADSLRIDQLAAFSLIALGRTGEARIVVERLLKRSPELELDPKEVSPKIRALFEQVRQELKSTPVPPRVKVDTVLMKKPYPISVLVPGIHRLRRGDKGVGIALLSLGVTSLAGLVVSEIGYEQAHRAYLNATLPSEIARRYQTANDWHHSRLIFGGVVISTELFSLIDALRTP